MFVLFNDSECTWGYGWAPGPLVMAEREEAGPSRLHELFTQWNQDSLQEANWPSRCDVIFCKPGRYQQESWTLNYFSHGSDESSLRREGRLLSYRLRVQSTVCGGGRSVQQLGTWHPQSGSRGRRAALSVILLFIQFKTPACGIHDQGRPSFCSENLPGSVLFS